MSRTVWRYLLVFTLFAIVYIAPLGLRPMVTPDEFRYAEIPRAMLAHSDWVTPQLDGLMYFEKPVLGYWLTAGAISLFGENSFSVRLPAALSAGLSALFVLWLVGRERDTTLPAAVILLTSLQFFGTGVFAVLDGPFTALITGTMASFFAAYTSTNAARRRLLLGLAGVLCGGAFMTKGFIAFAIPVLSIAPFLAFERKRPAAALKLVCIPALTAVLISLPWGVLIYLRSPKFWSYFLWTEHIQRFLAPAGTQHPEPIWFFLPILAIGALPWSPMIPAAVHGLRDRGPMARLLVFSMCWFVSTLVFFSFSSGKLATYILPVFPPLAILTAAGLNAYLRSGRRRLWRAGALILATLVSVGAVALVVNRLVLYDASSQWRPAILALALTIWSAAALAAARAPENRSAITLFAISPLPFLLCLHLALPVKPLRPETPGALLERNAFRARPGTAVVSDIDTIHAACWIFKRDDILILDKSGELTFGIEEGGAADRHLTPGNIGSFLASGNVERVLVAAETATFERYRQLLPSPIFEDRDGGLVVAELKLTPSSSVHREELAVDNGRIPRGNLPDGTSRTRLLPSGSPLGNGVVAEKAVWGATPGTAELKP